MGGDALWIGVPERTTGTGPGQGYSADVLATSPISPKHQPRVVAPLRLHLPSTRASHTGRRWPKVSCARANARVGARRLDATRRLRRVLAISPNVTIAQTLKTVIRCAG